MDYERFSYGFDKKTQNKRRSKPKSQPRKKVTDKQRKKDGDKIHSKSVNNESRKPKVDEVKTNITDKDIDKIQVNNKQKSSERDTKESLKVENKWIEKSDEVESLQKYKPNIGVPKESKPDIVKETEAKEKVKSAKDWGRASNDPRNKS